MTHVEHAVNIRVPLNIVYQQWTQFESFPYFMEGIKSVKALSDIKHIWLGEIGSEEGAWYTEITQQIPNQLIAWHTTDGAKHWVVVRFFYLTDDATRLVFQLEYAPNLNLPNPIAAADAAKQRVIGNIERFRTYIEDQNYTAGLWRGTVERAVDELWLGNV